jgi:opacity protein-like surface antigen
MLLHRLGRLAAALVLLALPAAVRAEDVEKKFRISVAAGFYNTQDEVRSPSANTLVLTNPNDEPVAVFIDPRNDNAAIGELTIEPAPRVTLSGSYAFNRFFVLEAAAGYQKSDVGDIEVQANFNGRILDENEEYHFDVFPVTAGAMTQIPLQLTALARFRPKANLNPYLGGGIGYTVVGFDSDPELDQLSLRMDRAVGALAPLSNSINGAVAPSIPSADQLKDLTGAHVDARDTFEWHLAGGMEYSFQRKWAAFLDARYIFASRSFSIGFNGAQSLGLTVPQRTEHVDTIFATQLFGPYYLPNGALVDAGRIGPLPNAPQDTDCSVPTNAGLCGFVFQPDGVTDPGMYYVQGGTIKYGGISLQVGVRYTF